LNGKHVVFGEVLTGKSIVEKMELVGSRSGAPSETVLITNSGIVAKDDVVIYDRKWNPALLNNFYIATAAEEEILIDQKIITA
jgi:hypothetical protein